MDKDYINSGDFYYGGEEWIYFGASIEKGEKWTYFGASIENFDEEDDDE